MSESTHFPKSRGALRLAIGTVVTALALLTATGTAAAASWQYAQLDGDRYYDASYTDRDGNGVVDDLWFDLDNDGRWDTHLYNSRYTDALLEVALYDMNENGVAEYKLLDTDQRVGFEYVYFNLNQDGQWDYRRIVPGSSADYINRINTNNANNRELHRFTMRTGQSLLYPSFSMPY